MPEPHPDDQLVGGFAAATCPRCGVVGVIGRMHACNGHWKVLAIPGAFTAASSSGPQRRDPLGCVHLLHPTDQSTEQEKCGCPGAKTTTVWECELHGLCAPQAIVTTLDRADVTACVGCKDYQA